MIFNTWSFAVFTLLFLTCYWALCPRRMRPHLLVLGGACFYAWSIPAYLALIVSLSVITYGIAQRIAQANSRRAAQAWLVLGICTIAGTLIAFKYTAFFALTINEVQSAFALPVPKIIAPLAISFFTFEFIHVLVDVYAGKIKRITPLAFAAFTFFFPAMVAGPVKRYQLFVPSLDAITAPDSGDTASAITRIALGLAKKYIIADSMTALCGPLSHPGAEPYGRLDFWVAIIAYTIKIYADFSGYSDVAIGAGVLLGFRLPENFSRPYRSANISLFWRRWHMALSSWIRDYIFIPMGGSRRPPLLIALNMLSAMFLVGLWHGANWTFVVWGLWHGAGLVIHRAWSKSVVARAPALFRGAAVRYASVALTLAFTAIGWVFFATPSFTAAITVLQRSFLP